MFNIDRNSAKTKLVSPPTRRCKVCSLAFMFAQKQSQKEPSGSSEEKERRGFFSHCLLLLMLVQASIAWSSYFGNKNFASSKYCRGMAKLMWSVFIPTTQSKSGSHPCTFIKSAALLLFSMLGLGLYFRQQCVWCVGLLYIVHALGLLFQLCR